MMVDMITLVAVLAVIQVLVFGVIVGRARERFGVPAPATTGPPEWERLHRVHQNSIEQLVVFLPLLVVAVRTHGRLAVLLGITYLVARIVYAVGYARAPEGRRTGAILTFVVQVVTALLALIGPIHRLLSA